MRKVHLHLVCCVIKTLKNATHLLQLLLCSPGALRSHGSTHEALVESAGNDGIWQLPQIQLEQRGHCEDIHICFLQIDMDGAVKLLLQISQLGYPPTLSVEEKTYNADGWCIDGWIDGRQDGGMEGQMDRWTDG